MQVESLFKDFDKLQLVRGDKKLNAIYGCGQTNNPALCLVFMNPTAKNVSAHKDWKGIRAPWLGTKNIWKMLAQLNLISPVLANKIASKKPAEWNPEFAEEVYQELANNSIYITNLSKATQVDARHLSNKDFYDYIPLLHRELIAIQPKTVVTFGTQVSSLVAGKNVKLAEHRKKSIPLKTGEHTFKVFPVFYPVGQGMRNMPIARVDIDWIRKNA